MKIIACLCVAFLLGLGYSHAQVDDSTKNDAPLQVEQRATFPGGNHLINKYVSDKLAYPKDAIAEGVEGRVNVTFFIDKEGKVKDAKVVKSLHPSLDKAAIDVIKGMPDWEPAMYSGKPVKSSYTLPISFKLTK